MRALILSLGALLWGAFGTQAQGVPFQTHGSAWVEGGRIMQSSNTDFSDPLTGPYTMDINDTWMQTFSAQITLKADLSERLDGAFGFGAYRVSHAQGQYNGSENSRFLAISMQKSFLTEANLSYYQGGKANPLFVFTAGAFVYNYNHDSRNLGLYLLRGPVYPGLLMGGADDFSTDTTRANVLGARFHQDLGNFSHDVIFKNERELPPTFDWSLAYIAKYRLFNALEVGGGVNFQRVLPYDSDLMKPGKVTAVRDPSMYEVNGTDTTYFSHQGTKLMAMFSFDLKPWIALPRAKERDLKLYGEAAIIGIKDYGETYGDVTERIPVMAGFNFPTFGLLDMLSLEVEWYGSPYRNDLVNIGNPSGIVADWTAQQRPTPSPGPGNTVYADSTRDNVKWSVTVEKFLSRQVFLTAQFANDHYRPRPMATGLIAAGGGTAEAFTTPRDWYFKFRLGYFF